MVIIDNCNTHNNSDFKTAVSATGAMLMYLPPYTPQYNAVSGSGRVGRCCSWHLGAGCGKP